MMAQPEPLAALLVVDVQQGLFEEPAPVYRADEVLRNINTLVKDAHSTDSPDGGHVIEHWNEKLSRGIVHLQATAEVLFGTAAAE